MGKTTFSTPWKLVRVAAGIKYLSTMQTCWLKKECGGKFGLRSFGERERDVYRIVLEELPRYNIIFYW